MKLFLFFIFVVTFAPSLALARDESFCKITIQDETISGGTQQTTLNDNSPVKDLCVERGYAHSANPDPARFKKRIVLVRFNHELIASFGENP